jgi:hypothetical protein
MLRKVTLTKLYCRAVRQHARRTNNKNFTMKTRSQSILFAITISILIYACNSKDSNNDAFALYTTKEVLDSLSKEIKTIPEIKRYISIPHNTSLDRKITNLLDSISKYSFKNLKIKSLGIKRDFDGLRLLTVNLLENPGFKIPDSLGNYRTWYDFFQGSTGGLETTITLTESILQKDYKGEWIDKVEFYYQNEPIGEWDHIFLSGQIKRK